MLVLGERYRFSEHEILRLREKFKTIKFVSYKLLETKKVQEIIEEMFQKEQSPIIVLNTKAKMSDTLIKYLTHLKFLHPTHHFEIITIEHFLEKYLQKCYIPEDNTNLFFLDDIQEYSKLTYLQKRLIDYIFSVVLLLLLPFIHMITKYKMKKESQGDLYFKQPRIGKNNQVFLCIKFRTMHEHDTENDVRIATPDDERKFPWGDFMRKTRLDEIPQVFNILKGEMHLVGPRAEWMKLVAEYEQEIPFYNQRHIVAPGITGWAQVMFVEGRAKYDTKQKLMYDLYYIKNWSLKLELLIIFKTIKIMLGQKGI